MRKGTKHKESSKELTRQKMKAWWQTPAGERERQVASAYRSLLRRVAEASVLGAGATAEAGDAGQGG